MKIYISGAITGTDDFMERFDDAERFVLDMGCEVINPAKVNAQLPKSTTWDEYMEMSMCMLKMCDSIYMLNNWEHSKGAKLELAYAIENDLTILYERRRITDV